MRTFSLSSEDADLARDALASIVRKVEGASTGWRSLVAPEISDSTKQTVAFLKNRVLPQLAKPPLPGVPTQIQLSESELQPVLKAYESLMADESQLQQLDPAEREALTRLRPYLTQPAADPAVPPAATSAPTAASAPAAGAPSVPAAAAAGVEGEGATPAPAAVSPEAAAELDAMWQDNESQLLSDEELDSMRQGQLLPAATALAQQGASAEQVQQQYPQAATMLEKLYKHVLATRIKQLWKNSPNNNDPAAMLQLKELVGAEIGNAIGLEEGKPISLENFQTLYDKYKQQMGAPDSPWSLEGFMEFWSQAADWQKLSLLLGIPVALGGLASLLFGEGGLGSFLVSALGIGGAAYAGEAFGEPQQGHATQRKILDWFQKKPPATVDPLAAARAGGQDIHRITGVKPLFV